MTLIDTLRPEHRRLLRRLRKRIANRENMRRYRNDINYMQLCPGVDLPLEAGTCGRLIWPESTRCTACRKRRHWLLQYALNPIEVALTALLDGAEADDAEHDDGAREDFGQAVPLLDELPALGDPCAGSARTIDPVEDDTAVGASRDDTRDHLPAVVPTLDELTDLGDPRLRW
ncbi:MAG: hypothetical protein OXF98_00705 [Rhodospirillaceae bacterium]|nr:hypothetical protein [Rhodospirillaceae bacterium]